MVKIGYARVSTHEQCLDLQLIALRQAGCGRIETDHGVSGSRQSRPGLNQLLENLKQGDTLVVWRLDRLGRSLSHLLSLISDLRARGIHFESLTELIATGSPSGMFMFQMIGALAEFERALISERTRAGVAAARMRGQRLGRPRLLDDTQLELARTLLAYISEADVARHLGVHRRTLRNNLLVCNATRSSTSAHGQSALRESAAEHCPNTGNQPTTPASQS